MTDKSPVDFFQLLIPDDLLQVVVQETNRFAQQYIDTTGLSRFSRVRAWEKKPHNLADLKKFLAIVIVMGFVVLPRHIVNKMALCHAHLLQHLETRSVLSATLFPPPQ